MADEPSGPPPPQAEEQAGPLPANKPPSPADRIKPWQFKPGQSGNPDGRPKKVTSEYEKMLETQITEKMATAYKLPETCVGQTFREAIAFGQGAAGARGATEAAREIADRVEGKVETGLRIRDETAVEEILRRLWIKKMGTSPPSLDMAPAQIEDGDGDEFGFDEAPGGDGSSEDV